MGHDKLRKFAENETFRCLLQPSSADILIKDAGPGLHLKGHPVKGRWNEEMFSRPRPIVLELGCGKGDYTIALARKYPDMNFIGVDIKGARLWKGAKTAETEGLGNVAFLRTRIEFIEAFFAPGEVSGIWLTFSDPQLTGENKRLSSPLFLERYRKFLTPDAVIRLKTDSRFLYEYTMAVARANGLTVLMYGTDIYNEDLTYADGVCPLRQDSEVFTVQTFYEKYFLSLSLPISFMAFRPRKDGPYVRPDFDAAYWREKEGGRRTFNHMIDNE